MRRTSKHYCTPEWPQPPHEGRLVSQSLHKALTALERNRLDTPFGSYLVVPDDKFKLATENINQNSIAPRELIRRSEYEGLGRIYADIEGGRGPIKIAGSPDYTRRWVAQFGILLSKPSGRKLVTDSVAKGLEISLLSAPAVMHPRTECRDTTTACGYWKERRIRQSDGKEVDVEVWVRGTGARKSEILMHDSLQADNTLWMKTGYFSVAPVPLFAVLAHELSHSVFDITKGSEPGSTEASAIERANAVHVEHGIPARDGHKSCDIRTGRSCRTFWDYGE